MSVFARSLEPPRSVCTSLTQQEHGTNVENVDHGRPRTTSSAGTKHDSALASKTPLPAPWAPECVAGSQLSMLAHPYLFVCFHRHSTGNLHDFNLTVLSLRRLLLACPYLDVIGRHI